MRGLPNAGHFALTYRAVVRQVGDDRGIVGPCTATLACQRGIPGHLGVDPSFQRAPALKCFIRNECWLTRVVVSGALGADPRTR